MLGVGPPLGCVQRALLVLWLLRSGMELIVIGRALTHFADFELMDEGLNVG